eukprot:CAMPEP_0197500210 /NCGR_PEP_ID=MMETSP1311-20131121/61414_1 /TAXON_ID=464262 /ORGANISM="Genus nov. species nov., Strain RCC856" /LENGTH=273 /DNA_ID=CAMNT_0043045961 /DNA_START=123 /DNA_END=941 /DNA_ORIENTATION=-
MQDLRLERSAAGARKAPSLVNRSVDGAVDGVNAVRRDEVARAEPHLEVHFPGALLFFVRVCFDGRTKKRRKKGVEMCVSESVGRRVGRASIPPSDDDGAVDGVNAVRRDEVARAEPHLEVHFPGAQPEEVWVESSDVVGHEDRNVLRGGHGGDGVVPVARDGGARLLRHQPELDLPAAHLPLALVINKVPKLVPVQLRHVLDDDHEVLRGPGVAALAREPLRERALVLGVLHHDALAQVADGGGAQALPPEVQRLRVIVPRHPRHSEARHRLL